MIYVDFLTDIVYKLYNIKLITIFIMTQQFITTLNLL